MESVTKWARAALFMILTLVAGAASGNPAIARERIGIIGGGGSGVAAAWLLEQDYDVTIFEKESRLGGHADTAYVDIDGTIVPMEVGFEFFRKPTYPLFRQLLKLANVPVKSYPMFYTFHRPEYDQTFVLPPYKDGGPVGEIVTLPYLQVLFGLKAFMDRGAELLAKGPSSMLLEEWVNRQGFSGGFRDGFLYPFLAGLWGVPIPEVKKFVAYGVLRWLVPNTGDGILPPEFHEIPTGLTSYINAVAAQFRTVNVQVSTEVSEISRADTGYVVRTADGRSFSFDQVVVATNASIASKLIRDVPGTEALRALLDKVEYFRTWIAIHGDTSWMPRDRSAWSVVNIKFDQGQSAITANKPWKHPTKRVFKSWVTKEKLENSPLPRPLYALREYYHPKINLNYHEMQLELPKHQGKNGLWIAGMYTSGIDNHESAIASAVRIAQSLSPGSTRLKQLLSEESARRVRIEP